MPRLAAVLTIAALAVIPIALHAQGAQPLRVIRVAPAGEANPMAQISVTFSKPITGSLDRVINPKTILKVEPPVVGRIEWRDPVTIRLVPSTPLKAGIRYTVTVANNFKAMDGSALMEPYTFAFRAQGPTIMEGFPVGPPASSTLFSHATPNQQFQLAFTNGVSGLAKREARNILLRVGRRLPPAELGCWRTVALPSPQCRTRTHNRNPRGSR